MNVKFLYEKIEASNLDSIYEKVGEKLYEKKYIKSKKIFINQLKKRDEKGDNYVGNGIFLPHIKSKNILNTLIYVISLEINIEKIDTVIFILVNDNKIYNSYDKIVEFVKKLDDIDYINKIKEGRYGN